MRRGVFHRLTFNREGVHNARFLPNGQNIVCRTSSTRARTANWSSMGGSIPGSAGAASHQEGSRPIKSPVAP